MSSNNVNVNDLAEAVGEDPDLTPDQKETVMRLAKDGKPDEDAPEFEYDVVHTFTEEAGLCRRWLKNPRFTLTDIRVNDSQGKGRKIAPTNFSGGRVTAIWGYLPVDSIIAGKSMREYGTHADMAPFQQSSSDTSKSESDKSSTSPSETPSHRQTSDDAPEAGQSATNTGNSPKDSNSVSTTDPLDW